MDISYGIGVKNRYAVFLFEENEDPLEAIAKQEDDKTRHPKKASVDKGSTAFTPTQNNVRDRTTLNDKSKTPSVNNKAVNNAKQNAVNATNTTSKPKTNDASPQSQAKPKESINKAAEAKAASTGGNRANKDRTFRNRDSYQTGEKTNHLTNSDRSNRPPRPQTTNDQKEIDEYKNQRNREERLNNPEIREKRERSDSERKNRGGRSNGSRRGRFTDSRGKRDLDRHSGSDKSGVKAVDKREGGGAFNWGKYDENADEAVTDSHDNAERSADENAFETNDTNQDLDTSAPEGETDQKAVDEPREMTLDEWKREQEGARVAPKFNLRKPGEGEDNSQWKKTFVLKKKEDEEEVEYEEIEVDEELSKKGRQKQLLDIEINFRDETRDFQRRGDTRRGRGGPRGGGADRERGEGREGRGGRGRDRPFETRGRGRGNRSKEQSAPKVDDWNEFPSILAP